MARPSCKRFCRRMRSAPKARVCTRMRLTRSDSSIEKTSVRVRGFSWASPCWRSFGHAQLRPQVSGLPAASSAAQREAAAQLFSVALRLRQRHRGAGQSRAVCKPGPSGTSRMVPKLGETSLARLPLVPGSDGDRRARKALTADWFRQAPARRPRSPRPAVGADLQWSVRAPVLLDIGPAPRRAREGPVATPGVVVLSAGSQFRGLFREGLLLRQNEIAPGHVCEPHTLAGIASRAAMSRSRVVISIWCSLAACRT